MSTYAIGDVQGCFKTLERLLETIAFEPGVDRLWFAGDLVNRGPGSLEALRFVYAHRDSVQIVLGNHDLHLLGRVAGVRRAGRRDTLDEVLAASDRDELITWLRAQPLVFRDGDRLMVHAGLLPAWTADEALRRSRAVESVLAGPEWATLLGSLYTKRRRPPEHAEALETLSITTLLRILDRTGTPALEFKRGPDDKPPGAVAWFDAPDRKTADQVVLFGHWAALGLVVRDDIVALDSGCVWGHQLTALRLEDRVVFQVDNAE